MTKKRNLLQSAINPADANAEKTLRQKAVDALQKKRALRTPVSSEDAQRLLHELEVHQIELELQNEELRHAQAEIETSKARYFDLYDFAPIGYFTLSEKGLIIEANLTACSLLGVARNKLLNFPLSRFILADDASIYHLHLNKLFETGVPQTLELRMHGKNETPFWVRVEATVAQDGDSASVCRAVIIDITVSKQLEDAQLFLLQCGYTHPGENFFQSLAKYLADILKMDFVCIDRLEDDGLNARTVAVWCDARFDDNISYALKDTPCGAVVGKTICCFEKDVRHLFPKDEALQELRAESYAGTTLWSNTGKPIGLIAVISRRPLANLCLAESLLKLVAIRAAGELERKQAEEDIRASEARFRSYFNLPLHGIAITSPEKGWIEVNDRLCAIMGYSHDEILRMTWPEMTHPDDLAADLEQFNQLMSGQIEQYSIDKRFIRKDGTIVWTSLTVGCVRKSDGSVNYLIALVEDITYRKIAEKQLLAKNTELERFTYTVSHDLKSPLVTIKTFLGHLVQDVASANKERVAQDLGFIHNAADKMNALLEELLDLSRIGRVVLPPVEAPLQTIVQEALDLVAGRIANRGVKVVVTQEPLILYGDRIRLVEVFQNLIDNAVKFIGEQSEPLIDIGAETKNGDIVCFVRDNGMGIDPRYKDKLFSLFEKLNPEMEGTGMGLVLVKRIIEVHGGRIWFESEGLGKGTCFWFSLPSKQVQG